MTKFVILSQTLSFIAIERSKSDIILCQIMTKFVVFLTLKGLNDKVGPRDVDARAHAKPEMQQVLFFS